jgi:hypothetical protein
MVDQIEKQFQPGIESLDGLPHDILLEIVGYLDRMDNMHLGLVL